MTKRGRSEEKLTRTSEGGLIIQPQFEGLPAMLSEACFSDIVIRCPDGVEIHAHRVILAAGSDVFKAKFTGLFQDSKIFTCQQDVGSSECWRWLIGWIYGCRAAMPEKLMIEMLVLADMFQVTRLAEAIQQACVEASHAVSIVHQILCAPACPVVLQEIAQRTVPKVRMTKDLFEAMIHGSFSTIAMILPLLDMPSERERLDVLNIICSKDGRNCFPKCFVDCIQWDLLSVHDLKAGLNDANFAFCGEAIAKKISLSLDTTSHMKDALLKAVLVRCERLESSAKDPWLLPDCPSDGLFVQQIKRLAGGVAITLSSQHPQTNRVHPAALLNPWKKEFGTAEGDAPTSTWIELRSDEIMILPKGIGLMHGWQAWDVCCHFVIEAACDTGSWTELLRISENLIDEGKIYHIPESIASDLYFNRFRIRMLGPNTSNRSYLMVGWFDVFGTRRDRFFHDLLKA